MTLLLRWLLLWVALLVTVHIGIPGLQPAGSVFQLLLATLALGFINLLARPAVFLLKLVTLPLSCLTFGLWALVLSLFVNTLVFYFVGSLGWGFRVSGFWSAALGALVTSLLSTVLTGLFEVGRRAHG
jgi:putative membrane protein